MYLKVLNGIPCTKYAYVTKKDMTCIINFNINIKKYYNYC